MMSGVWVETNCERCGEAMRTRTGTVTLMRTTGRSLTCRECRRKKDNEQSVEWHRRERERIDKERADERRKVNEARNKKDRERYAKRREGAPSRTYEKAGFKTWRRPKGAEYLAKRRAESR
jgi:hypothetical protein